VSTAARNCPDEVSSLPLRPTPMRSPGVAADSIDRHKVAITAKSPCQNAVRAGALPSLVIADEHRSAKKTPSLPRGSLFLDDEGPLVAVRGG
jgi:hypothetical protein